MTPRQLAFDLPHRPALDREAFFAAPSNAAALAAVEGWRGWPGGRMLLVGPTGAGKTHLAHVFAAACRGAVVVPARGLVEADVPRLAALPGVAVEDAEAVAGDRAAETVLFHLHNLVLAEGGRLLLTAALPPRDWGVGLPDLLSRMQAAPLVRVEPPCDALLSALLEKLFADRQIEVTPSLIRWLVPRIERSFAAAGEVVARLDAAALARRQPLTRKLAAEVLGQVLDSGAGTGDDG
ncbi:MAG: chromosomal replication initiator DnaA [Gemmobacter sp.]